MIRALLLAWTDLLRPRVFSVLMKGIGLTILIFLGLQAAAFFALRAFAPATVHLPFGGSVPLASILSWGSLALLPLMGFFLMAPVAAGFSGLYAETVADTVEDIHYPARPGTAMDFFESIPGALGIMGMVLLVSLLTLVLTPVLGPFAPLFFYGANGWLLGREYFQMAARRHMDADTTATLGQRNAAAITLTGISIAFLLTVPLLNIAIPVLAAAAFTHLVHGILGDADRAPQV
jgi:CysZ protein